MEPRKLTLGSALKTGGRDHFPRPDIIRNPSYLLDGEWLMCPDEKFSGILKSWHTREFGTGIYKKSVSHDNENIFKIKVPYPLESDINQKELSPRDLTADKIKKIRRFWYFKSFKRPVGLYAGMLNFGAVDYKAKVWINGELLGTHEGGYTPFSFIIEKFEDQNMLTVLVEDHASGNQIRGKQGFNDKIFPELYPACTGIWQPVWIEPLGRIFINALSCRRDREEKIIFSIELNGHDTAIGNVKAVCRIFASQIYQDGKGILKSPIKEYTEFTALDAMKRGHLEFMIPEKIFNKWNPGWPAIHPLEISILSDGKELDKLHILYGSRQIETDNGVIKLNKKRIYQKLVLHQGYYPGGHYTPESTDQFKTDISLMKNAGFNGCRLHQKIENPVFLYWADLLGFLVWEEMPSYYIPLSKNMAKLESLFRDVAARDFFHPSIITFVLFNESMGIYNIFFNRNAHKKLIEFINTVKDKYPGYLVVDNSGFHHIQTDIMDIHHYIQSFEEIEAFYYMLAKGVREAPFWYNFIRMLTGKENVQTPCLGGYGETKSPLFISEFGAFGSKNNKMDNLSIDQFLKKHLELINKFPKIQGFCYRQFADTFKDTTGLFTAEREAKTSKIRDYIQKLVHN